MSAPYKSSRFDTLGGPAVVDGAADPSASGRSAPAGSLYARTDGSAFFKFGAGNLDWKVLAGGGLVQPVEKQVIPAGGATSVRFAGLDGDADVMYRIIIAGELAADDTRISLVAETSDGDKTAGESGRWRINTDGTSSAVDFNNNVYICKSQGSNGIGPVYCDALVWAGRDRSFLDFYSKCSHYSNALSTVYCRDWQGFLDSLGFNLLGFRLESNIANALAENTEVSLYKLPLPQAP